MRYSFLPLLLVVFVCSFSRSLDADPSFRRGIRSHDDWIQRYKKEHDWKILHLLINRAGFNLPPEESERVSGQLKESPDKIDDFFKKYRITLDLETENEEKKNEWIAQYKDDAYVLPMRHYLIFATQGNEDIAKTIGYYMDRVFAFYEKKFEIRERIEDRFRVYIYPNKQDFLQTTSLKFAYAYFSPSRRSLVGYYHQGDDLKQLLSAFFHEGFHQYLRYHFPSVPIWLNEGIAQNLEKVCVKKRRLIEDRKRDTGNSLRALQRLMRQNATTPLKDFIFMTQQEFYANPQVHYPMAWGVIHFFGYGNNRNLKKYYKEVMAELIGGASREEALKKIFSDVDWEKFETAYREYIFSLQPMDPIYDLVRIK